MAEKFGLTSKSMRLKLGRKSFFTPEGKVALMFLRMHTGLSCPKLMEQLNGNIHYQMFCDANNVKTRTKLTEFLYIFFNIHTANVVQLAARVEQRFQLAAA